MQIFLVSRGLSHGLLDEQIAQVTHELVARPGDRGLLLKRAELYRAHLDYQKAKADLQQLTQGDHIVAEALYFLARLEREAGNLPESKVAILGFLKLKENEPPGQREAAIIFGEMKDWKTSASYWRQLFANPNLAVRPAPDYEKGICAQIEAEEFDAAAELLTEGISRFPAAIPLAQLDGRLAMARGEWDRAHLVLDRLRNRYPTLEPRLRLNEGKLWSHYQRVNEARESWESGLEALKRLPAPRRNQQGMITLAAEFKTLLNQ